MTDPVLSAHAVSKTYRARRSEPVAVLQAVSLAVDAGDSVAIVGPSGSGKSTLLYCLAGLEPVSDGTVRLLGADLASLSRGRAARLRRSGVGFVFQSFNLIPSLSARENVALPARLARRRVSRAETDALLARVGLADRGGHRPGALSGGQQQRVAVARVLAARPAVIFADEPTGALDTATGAAVLDLLHESTTQGSALVLVTHDLDAAARADRVIVLRDGRVLQQLRRPSAAELFSVMTGTETAA